MTKKNVLPSHLHVAYDWTAAAGELEELRTTRAWRRYARESVANADAHDQQDVTESDLLALRAWLREQKYVS